MHVLILIGIAAVAALALGGKSKPKRLTIVVPLGESGDSVSKTAGSIRRSFPASPGGQGIDAREVRVGPLMPEIPAGKLLLITVELTVPSEPPALPGAPPSPCRALGSRRRYNARSKLVGSADNYTPQGCAELRKPGGGDYDVDFPDFHVDAEPDGLFFDYTWIAFHPPHSGHPSDYAAKPHTLDLRWELVDA